MKTLKVLFYLFLLFNGALNAQQNINEKLVLYLPFNNTAMDAGKNSYHPIVYGAIPCTDRNGIENSAYYFNGTSDFMAIPHKLFGEKDSSFTLTLWYNLIQNQQSMCKEYILLSNSISQDNVKFCMDAHMSCSGFNSGKFHCSNIHRYENNVPISDGVELTSNYGLTMQVFPEESNGWVFVALRVSYKGNKFSQKLNSGSQVKEYTCDTCNFANFQADTTYIGRTNLKYFVRNNLNDPRTDNFFFGKIDEICVFNDYLSDATIDSISQNMLPLGIQRPVSDESIISLFPNPALNFCKISNLKGNLVTVKILDSTGRMVLEQQNSNSLDLSKLNKGIYMVEIINIESSIHQYCKLIKE